MRTKNFFRTIVAVALCAVVSTSAFGQSILTNAKYTKIGPLGTNGSFRDTVNRAATSYTDYYEYATVGSTMPYAIRKDSLIQPLINSGLYVNSVFFLNINFNSVGLWTDWTTQPGFQIGDTGTLAGLNKLVDGDVTNPLTINAAQKNFPYTKDTVFAVKWKTKGAIGSETDALVWSDEWPVSNTLGMSTCEGKRGSLDVKIVDKPNVDWTVNQTYGTANTVAPWMISSCGSGGNNNVVNVNYKGYGDIKVNYDTTFYTLSNVIVGSTATKTTTLTQAFGAPSTQTAQKLTNWAPAAGTYGYVLYKINYVNDLISRKSLTRDPGAIFLSVAGVAGADPTFVQNTVGGVNMPGHTFKVYSLPVPSTRPVKHIGNTGW